MMLGTSAHYNTKYQLALTDQDKKQLACLIHSNRYHIRLRARIIALVYRGFSYQSICEALFVAEATVVKWVKRVSRKDDLSLKDALENTSRKMSG